MAFRLITRADDFGSARSANSAILEALAAGHMVRNVSCMAPGKYIEQDAGELVRYAGQVDFGLHYTLNSEWDSVKWNPCAPKESIPSLLDQTGNFYPSSEELRSANIRMEEAIAELDAQLEQLTTLGIPITYVDGHMFPDRVIPGLDEEMKAWAKRKGILCTNDCFALWRGNPEFADSIPAFWENVHSWLQGLPSEGYGLYVSHPAKYGPETLAFANSAFPSGIVAWEREQEYHSAVSSQWRDWVVERNMELIRFRDYDR